MCVCINVCIIKIHVPRAHEVKNERVIVNSPLTPNRIACDGLRKAFFSISFAMVTDSKS